MNAVRSDSVDFFLGTTTPAGFKGYFEPLRREPGMQMYLIKSGPGCGKSTLMKRLAVKAEQKGEPIQRIHCASDPDSLDGVIFLDKRAAIVDATAPHVMEPDAPGAEEQVVSLYHTLDADALHAHADEVKRLFAQNTALRSRAARYIASAGSLLLDSRRAEACSANFEKVRRYVKRLCARTLPRLPEGASASEELRLLSAITPKGPVFYRGTVQALADRGRRRSAEERRDSSSGEKLLRGPSRRPSTSTRPAHSRQAELPASRQRNHRYSLSGARSSRQPSCSSVSGTPS